MRRISLLVFLTWISWSATAGAALVAGRTATPPKIDGVLEDVWKGALVFDHFIQAAPAFGTDARAKTEVFALYDDEYLYLAARAHQPRASVRASSSRRDGASVADGDHVLFAIDPQGSGNSAYYFVVNAANAVNDGTLDAYGTWLRDWDARFVSATATDDEWWTVEMAVPLAAIGLESPQKGGFGLLVRRYMAEQQETSLSGMADRNSLYRIDKFDRITGMEAAKRRTSTTSVVPYAFGTWQSGSAPSNGGSAKGGLDVRTSPAPSMTILATINPDFGQIESDEQIINVSDVPAAYPEKRPFFTESSDLYPGTAVNTRNIGVIRAGVKMRQVLPTLRYDVTTVLDDRHTRWMLGDVRWTDNRNYHVEVIGGVKDSPAWRDFNVTTNLRTWFFDHRLTAYTWLSTINNHERPGREWASASTVKWDTRTLRAGIENDIKSEFYNPNVVGFDALSNVSMVHAWVAGSYFRSEGVIREISPNINVERDDLTTSRGHASVYASTGGCVGLHPAERLGVWRVTVSYSPASPGLFRYRGSAASPDEPIYRDAYSPFTLVRQDAPSLYVDVKSDASKRLSFETIWNEMPLRAGTARQRTLSTTWKLRQSSIISAVLDRVNVTASPYQPPFTETVTRLRVEHTFRSGLNVRAVFQNDALQNGSATRKPALNLLVSWPYDPRTTVYLVANDDRESREGLAIPANSRRNVALKVSHAVSF